MSETEYFSMIKMITKTGVDGNKLVFVRMMTAMTKKLSNYCERNENYDENLAALTKTKIHEF